MGNLDRPELTEEWKQNLDADTYGKRKPRCKSTIKEDKMFDRNNKTEYWPTIIKEGLKWIHFLISQSLLQTG